MMQATRARVAPLYARHSAAAARGSWSVTADIRWGDIDIHRAHRQPELLRAVRSAARELTARSADTARMMILAIRDIHACAALTLDLYDGLKHFHALRTYLDTVEFTPALTDEELADARTTASEADTGFEDCTSALVACLLTQHLAAVHFRHLCTRAEEPVLAELLSFIAADEARHGQILSDLLALQIDTDPAAGRRALAQAARLRAEKRGISAIHGWAHDDVAVQSFVRRVEEIAGRGVTVV
jgi:hypothetical protein